MSLTKINLNHYTLAKKLLQLVNQGLFINIFTKSKINLHLYQEIVFICIIMKIISIDAQIIMYITVDGKVKMLIV